MFVIVTRNYPPDIGGIQNLMEGLSNALLSHGPVKVFADAFDKSDDYDKKSKIDIQRVSGFKIFRKYRKANLIKEFIDNNNVRAIFFDHWKSIENINLSTLNKTKSFCLIHSKEINHSVGSLINKRMLKALQKANYVIANSRFTKNLANKLGFKKENIEIINPGTNYPIQINKDAKNFAKTIFQNSFPKLITISRLDGRKSHENILMTIKNLLPKYPNLKYVSIGDGEKKDDLEKLKKELKLNNQVNFIYTSSEQEKVALLEESDVFLMPSIIYKKSVEGFGITFIEAASYGVPSIGGIFGGESDAIQDGKTGYLCDGNDLTEIYNTLIRILEKDNYKKLGSNALIFSKNFNWSQVVKKYIQLI